MVNDELSSGQLEQIKAVNEKLRKYTDYINHSYTALEIKEKINRFFNEIDQILTNESGK